MSDSKLRKRVSDYIQKNRVVLFTKSYCPYSQKAKYCVAFAAGIKNPKLDTINKELYKKGIVAIDLDLVFKKHPQVIPKFQSLLADLSDGQSTVPRVFIRGKFIGGGTKVEELYDAGQLKL